MPEQRSSDIESQPDQSIGSRKGSDEKAVGKLLEDCKVVGAGLSASGGLPTQWEDFTANVCAWMDQGNVLPREVHDVILDVIDSVYEGRDDDSACDSAATLTLLKRLYQPQLDHCDALEACVSGIRKARQDQCSAAMAFLTTLEQGQGGKLDDVRKRRLVRSFARMCGENPELLSWLLTGYDTTEIQRAALEWHSLKAALEVQTDGNNTQQLGAANSVLEKALALAFGKGTTEEHWRKLEEVFEGNAGV